MRRVSDEYGCYGNSWWQIGHTQLCPSGWRWLVARAAPIHQKRANVWCKHIHLHLVYSWYQKSEVSSIYIHIREAAPAHVVIWRDNTGPRTTRPTCAAHLFPSLSCGLKPFCFLAGLNFIARSACTRAYKMFRRRSHLPECTLPAWHLYIITRTYCWGCRRWLLFLLYILHAAICTI